MMLLQVNRRHLLRERHLADLRSSMVRDASSHCRTHWQYHRWSWHLHSVRCITSRNEHGGGMLPVANKVRRGRRFMSIYLRWKKPVDQESTRISSQEESDLRGSSRPSWMAGIMTIEIPHPRVRVTSGLEHWRESQGKDSPRYQILKRKRISICCKHYGGQAGFVGDLCRSTANYGHPLADRRADDSWPKKLSPGMPRTSGQRSSHEICEWRHL